MPLKIQIAAALLGLTMCSVRAQPVPGAQAEIRGTVLEPGTNQPVEGAKVSLFFLGPERPNIRVGTGMLTAAGDTRTDASGAFVLHPGRLGYYSVTAGKDGYTAPASSAGGGNSYQDVTLTAAEPSGTARLWLTQPAQITGFVMDDETGRPIPGLRVTAVRRRLMTGRWMFMGNRAGMGVPATTGADGQFTVRDLSAGDYVIGIGPQVNGKERIFSKFNEEDLRRVDDDYQTSYWPGGYGAESAIPVLVSSGVAADIGRIRAKRIKYYRLHVRIPAGSCEPGDAMEVYEATPGSLATISERQPCAPEMLIAGFPAGAYRLVLTILNRGPETRQTASIPFVVKDENVELIAPLERGVTVEATLTAADGAAAPDLSKAQLTLYPIGAMPIIDIASPKKPDEKGRIRFAGVPPVNQQIMFSGLGPGSYVKEVRYNGATLSDLVLPFDRAAAAHSLIIAIDDKPAAVAGVVTERDNPVPNPYLILAKWPLPGGDSPYYPQRIAGDEKGRFQFTGLAPGEYRIVAVRSRQEDDDREPGALERALAVARKIELGPSGSEDVTIPVGTLK